MTLNRKPYQVSKPEKEFHMIDIIYAACGIAHVRTIRKDNIFMQRRLYIDEAHTALDIFRFAVFFLFKLITNKLCRKNAVINVQPLKQGDYPLIY